MPDDHAEDSASFQPGQLGVRHLLGAMAVASLILGVTATRLRTMTAVEAAQVAYHWFFVLIVAVGGYMLQSLWRRRTERNAGELWLTVQQKPVSPKRRQWIRWLLTLAVVADGIFIGFAAWPAKSVWEGFLRSPVHIQLPMLEGWLWLSCIRNWLSNPYLVEFREHGILAWNMYYPWKSMTHLGWSGIYPNKLAFVCHRHIAGLQIEPAGQAAVSDLLKRLRSDPNMAGVLAGG